MSATVGEFEVRVNGVQVLNLANANTAAGGITSYQTIGIGMHYANAYINYLYDDLYICNRLGTANNNFLGPISAYSLMPISNGTSTQLSVTGSASNWQAVNETANNTTTYVSTGTTGQKDYYNFETLPASVVSVMGVQLRARSTTPTAGTRKVILNIKNAASVVSSSLRSLTMGTWLQEYFIADTAPDGSAWDPTKVNSTEGGVEAG